MNRFHARALVLVTLAFALSGCNSFLGIKIGRSTPNEAPAKSVAAAKAETIQAASTELGRSQLAQGQTGAAIESFRLALANGEPVAPAVNGLGVAYVRIGRFDLAKQYFEQAQAADPMDSRYSNNLYRVILAMRYDGIQLASAQKQLEPRGKDSTSKEAAGKPDTGRLTRVSPGEVRVATAPAEKAPLHQTATGLTEASASRGRIVRLSRGEVRIAAAQPAPAPAQPVARKIAGRFEPLIRISFADLESPSKAAPDQ